MSESVIRPSTKLIKASYWTALLIAAAVFVWSRTGPPNVVYLLAVPAVMLVWTAARHIRRSFTRLSVGGGKLRFETGILSRATRTMEVRKVQDVRVDQTLAQRMLGTGDLSIETAGETSRWTIQNIDSPQKVADSILAAAHEQGKEQSA